MPFMAPIYTNTDSSRDKKKKIKMSHSLCYPSKRETVTGRESVDKKYEGSEGVELTEIKQQHNLLYNWADFMANVVKDSGIKKQTDGNVLQRLKFMRIRQNSFTQLSVKYTKVDEIQGAMD